MKRAAVVAGCLLVGLGAGAIWTLLQADRYRADARVLVRPQTSRIVPAVEALAESSLVESNVAQTLHLTSSPNISAKRGDGGVLTVSVEQGSRERARQVDAEAVVILTQKVAQRFGTAGVSATVLDPAHVAEETSPTPGRNLLISGLAGLLAGLAAALALSRPRVAAVTDPRVERRLQTRIDQVAKRERALAQRAGQIAAREGDLDRREHELAAREAELEAAPPEPLPEPEPEPEPEPVPEPEPAPAPQPVATGGWNINDLEARVAASHVSEDTREEWRSYLFFLRDHAASDGSLPSQFDGLVRDVFAALV